MRVRTDRYGHTHVQDERDRPKGIHEQARVALIQRGEWPSPARIQQVVDAFLKAQASRTQEDR